jgi:predicted secreted protein
MAKQCGCDGSLSIGSTVVGYIDTWSLSINKNDNDITQLGKKWREYMSTIKDWSGSFNATVLDSKEHKGIVEEIITNDDTELDCVFKAGNEVSFSGKVKVTSASISATQGEKTSLSINFQGNGALSFTGMTA